MKNNRKTRESIAGVTLQTLEREGSAAVSMRRVARAVGITPMAIYNHFPDREALLKTVTDAEFQKLLDFFEARQKGKSLKQRLIYLMDGYLDYALARPRIFDYVFSKPRADARRFPKDFRARRSPTLNPIADTVAKAMEAGLLRRDDVWEVALEFWAHAHGYITLCRAGRFALSDHQFRLLLRRSLKRLLRGLAATK